MDLVLKTMDFVLKTMDFVLKTMNVYIADCHIILGAVAGWVTISGSVYI